MWLRILGLGLRARDAKEDQQGFESSDVAEEGQIAELEGSEAHSGSCRLESCYIAASPDPEL